MFNYSSSGYSRMDRRGFTLLGIFIAIVVLGILAGAVAPAVQSMLESAENRAERQILAGLKEDIERSFEEVDTLRNVGALYGTGIGSNSTIAQPPLGLNDFLASEAVVTSADWQQKISRIRGQERLIGSTLDPTEPGVWYNSRRWKRFFLVGPDNEYSQRYLLVSMLTPLSRQLTFPAGPTELDVFNSLWDNSWESGSTVAPTAWSSHLSTSAYQEWDETPGGRTNASRLIVQRINQLKYELTVVNSHPSDSVWVDIGPYSDALHCAAGSGVSRSSTLSEFAKGIPSGRLIIVRRGTSSPGVEVQRFMLAAPVTITVQ